ncbi:MAG: hypothetical protein U0168_13020 [Nannocystaceae bacterium]
MNAEQQLQELERVAEQLRVEVSYEPMAGLVQGTGGLVKLRGQYRIIVDKRLRAAERVNILADALRRFDLARLELPAPVRRLLVRSEPSPAVARAPAPD